MNVQLLKELFGLEDLHAGRCWFSFYLLQLNDVWHEFAEAYLLAAKEMNHPVYEPDWLII